MWGNFLILCFPYGIEQVLVEIKSYLVSLKFMCSKWILKNGSGACISLDVH